MWEKVVARVWRPEKTLLPAMTPPLELRYLEVEVDNAATEVRGLRRDLGLTQEELAHKLGVTVSTVNRWENGHATPSKLAQLVMRALRPKK